MSMDSYERVTASYAESTVPSDPTKPAGPRVVFNKYWLRILLLAVALGIWREQALLTIAGLVGLAMGGGQLLWLRFCLAGVEYERHVSASRAFIGEAVAVDVQITNKKPLPLSWLLAQDQVSDDRLPIRRAGKLELSPLSWPPYIKSLVAMLPYARVHREYSVDCTQRGTFQFGPTTLESGDLLGYATRTITVPDVQQLLVYPKLFELDVPPRRSVRMIGPQKVDRIILTDPSRTVGVRSYRPGDPLRHVEWRASARSDELLVRIFEPTTDPSAAIFLNSEVPVDDWDFYDPPELEFSISLAASLSKWMLDRRYPVGLYGNGEPSGESAVRLPVSNQPAQLQRVLETLALATPFGPVRRRGREWWETTYFEEGGNRGSVRWRLPLGQLLLREAHKLPFEVSIILITTQFDPELLAACQELQRRRALTVLYVETKRSPAISFGGLDVVTVPYTDDWMDRERLQLAA